MGQVVVTLLSSIVLLIVPLSVMQVHTVMQMRSELLDVSLAATKFLSNRGGTSDSDVQAAVRQFIRNELESKAYRLEDNNITVSVNRTKAQDPYLWSHEDEFELRIGIPYPQITTFIPYEQQPLMIDRTGTINIMNYDL